MRCNQFRELVDVEPEHESRHDTRHGVILGAIASSTFWVLVLVAVLWVAS